MKVLRRKYLPIRPSSPFWWGWALWVTQRVAPLPQWLVGVLGTCIALFCLMGIYIVMRETEVDPKELTDE